ncbi:MAG TPA: hypothetical protein VHZ09_00230, partial [Acidobacteriaceae bacterium]|nr:hypothetical protein [Acidobacteriaceae bacterium]
MPLRLMAMEPIEQLLVSVMAPVALPATVGSKVAFNVAVWPACRLSGKETPDIEYPAPVRLPELTVKGAVPLDVRVIDWVAGELRLTLPNATLDAPTDNMAPYALSCSDALFVIPAAVAVMVAVCAVVTADAVAVKAALVAPVATVTDAATVSALLLLTRFTVSPPLGAAVVRLTVQASVVAPVRELLVQETALSATGAWPVPLRLTVAVPPAVALLVMVRVPV